MKAIVNYLKQHYLSLLLLMLLLMIISLQLIVLQKLNHLKVNIPIQVNTKLDSIRYSNLQQHITNINSTYSTPLDSIAKQIEKWKLKR